MFSTEQFDTRFTKQSHKVMTPNSHLQRHSPVSNSSHYPVVSPVHLRSTSDGTDAYLSIIWVNSYVWFSALN